jgi:hypothetical protein
LATAARTISEQPPTSAHIHGAQIFFNKAVNIHRLSMPARTRTVEAQRIGAGTSFAELAGI